ncbi:MAG: beta-glucuronidase [Lentisphaeria bacterium]|nr:beta-glucuronidase [Lentisphaeria bacterium]
MKIPRPEYPRPQFERKDFLNLNGEWDYAFDYSRSGEERFWEKGIIPQGKILVPFCPESVLSGVGFTDFIDRIWYQRSFSIPDSWAGKKILLHFGGVDYESVIYVDGTEVGRHTGGVTPFTVDLTHKVQSGTIHQLVLLAKDDVRSGLQPVGKQSPWLKSALCSYTRTTGIWQTVWMEAVDFCGLEKCRILPDYDNGSFTFLPVFYNIRKGMKFSVSVLDGEKEVASALIHAGSAAVLQLSLPCPRAWSPEDPFLYTIKYVVYDKDGKILDEVSSYAGLRKIHLEDGRYFLNNKPIFLRFVLDQGFYRDGIWTAPSDEALKQDILLAMKAGFNGARLHQKIFEERFHYWADHLGYLTWGEFADWGMSFWSHEQAPNPDYMKSFRNLFPEWTAVVERDCNHPSIITWSPFNETRSAMDITEHRRIIRDIVELTKKLDPSRPVNDTSGYCHVKTDLWTVHLYAQNEEELKKFLDRDPVYIQYPELEKDAWENQPYLVDEYGGVSFIPEGETPYADNSWGYNSEILDQQETEQRIHALTEVLVKHPRVAGYCYTQLTDIEQEQNGIYNYDRKLKLDEKVVRKCFTMKPSWSHF